MQREASLVEIMVSLMVLTTGMLGTARLQAVSLRAAVDSGTQGMAARVSYDMADRIRLEPTQIDAYVVASGQDLSAVSSGACYSGSGCGGADRVRAVVAEWQRLVAAQLPGGVGVVCRDSSPYDGTDPAHAQCSGGASDPLVVKIWWQARAWQDATAADGPNPTGTERKQFVAMVGL